MGARSILSSLTSIGLAACALDLAACALDLAEPAPLGRGLGRLALGSEHGCAIDDDRRVRCWGSNASGQLGQEPADAAPHAIAAVVPGLEGALAIAAGAHHSCALLEDRTVACWGSNDAGQLGTGASGERPHATPARVTGLAGAGDVRAGADHTCALLAGGAIHCWGSNNAGQLGLGRIDSEPHPTPEPVRGLGDATALGGATGIDAGPDRSCARLAGGTVLCWGSNESGALGVGALDRDAIAEPAVVALPLDVVDLALGPEHGAALLDDGSVLSWGANDVGQLGRGGAGGADEPTPSPSSISRAAQLSMGAHASCALLQTRRVACWGSNQFGQLALGDPSPRAYAAPIESPALDEVLEVAVGERHACCRRRDGVVCWGDNTSGQLGDGTLTPRGAPPPPAR